MAACKRERRATCDPSAVQIRPDSKKRRGGARAGGGRRFDGQCGYEKREPQGRPDLWSNSAAEGERAGDRNRHHARRYHRARAAHPPHADGDGARHHQCFQHDQTGRSEELIRGAHRGLAEPLVIHPRPILRVRVGIVRRQIPGLQPVEAESHVSPEIRISPRGR